MKVKFKKVWYWFWAILCLAFVIYFIDRLFTFSPNNSHISRTPTKKEILSYSTTNPGLFKEIMDQLVNKLDSQLQKDVKDVFNYIPTSKSAGDNYKVFEQQYEKMLKSQGVTDEGIIDLFKKDLEMRWNEVVPSAGGKIDIKDIE